MITISSVYEALLKDKRLVCALHKVLKFSSIITILFLIASCEQSTELPEPIPPPPYMSLQIGDMWQIYDPATDFYTQSEIVGTTNRTDGIKVFVEFRSVVLSDGLYVGQLCNYIANDYLLQTNKDTTGNLKGNRYEEHKLAKVFPHDGDYFLQTEGSADSNKVYFTVKMIDSLATPCGTFRNVAQYSVSGSLFKYPTNIYYAPYYGYIGSSVYVGDREYDLFITYVRRNGRELGKFNQLLSTSSSNQSKQNEFLKKVLTNNLYNFVQY